MQTEYTLSTGTKIFYYAIALLFAGFVCFLFLHAGNTSQSALIYLLSLILIVPVTLMANTATKKLTIGDDFIKMSTLLSTKQMLFADIKGYRIMVNKSSRSVIFQSNNGGAKMTVSSITDFKGDKELLEWIAANFTDLDAVDVQQEKNSLLENAMFGATPEEREASLKQAKNMTIGFAIGAGIIGFFTLFYDNKTWAALDMIYPFAGAGLIFTSKGLIKFITNSKRSIYPNISLGLLIISMAVFFKGLVGGEIYDAQHLWTPAILLTLVIAAAIFFAGKDKSMPIVGQVILLLFITAFCGFGNIFHINKLFDNSETQIYRVQVINKNISHGKHDSYYLYLSPVGPKNKEVTPDVGYKMYNATNVGDSINIYFKKGALNIPWISW